MTVFIPSCTIPLKYNTDCIILAPILMDFIMLLQNNMKHAVKSNMNILLRGKCPNTPKEHQRTKKLSHQNARIPIAMIKSNKTMYQNEQPDCSK